MGKVSTDRMTTEMTYRKEPSVRRKVPPSKEGGKTLRYGIAHLTHNLTLANSLVGLTLPYANLTVRPYAKPYAILCKVHEGASDVMSSYRGILGKIGQNLTLTLRYPGMTRVAAIAAKCPGGQGAGPCGGIKVTAVTGGNQ